MALYFSNSFISGTKEYSTLEQGVPAPYLRKSFVLEQMPEKAEIRICGLGFYELFLNGNKITKGALAPYISAADQIVHYDDYDVTQYLLQGENVIGVLLGNGNQNSFGAFIWRWIKLHGAVPQKWQWYSLRSRRTEQSLCLKAIKASKRRRHRLSVTIFAWESNMMPDWKKRLEFARI